MSHIERLEAPPREPSTFDANVLQRNRQQHLRRALETAGVDIAVLTNPVSMRYATGYRGYATFQSRIPSAYLLVGPTGPVVLHGAYTDELDTIDRCEVAHSLTTFDAGLDLRAAAARFVDDLEKFAAEAGLGRRPVIGLERSTPTGFEVLAQHGFTVVDVEPTIELTRARKVGGELAALRYAISVAEFAMSEMHAALQPGVTENELFAILHRTNIAYDGDWIDGRMLCSGQRTNPWYQEASHRVIERGDLMAFDTDMVGPYGYCADISRTWVCGADASPQQRDLHRRAVEEIEHNTALLRPGMSFAELSQKAFRHPDRFIPNRYACVYHGVGMTDEYPKIAYPDDWHWTGYDGELEEGTVLSVESYVGAVGGSEGVKLEQMVQVTSNGAKPLSTFPLGLG